MCRTTLQRKEGNKGMKKYCFGIDVGGTTVKCGLFRVDGTVMDKWEIKTVTENNGTRILPDVAETVLDKMNEKGITKEEVAGIGIGIPGPVRKDGTVERAVNLHWGFKNIVKEVEDITGLPVKAANDANVAALGEMWQGGGIGCRSLIMVTLGTGVGGGIIIDGQIVAGAHGAGGEIGHAAIDAHISIPCNCGNYGCLEQVASATGIARLAAEELAVNDTPTLLRREYISAKAVFDAYKKKDAVAAIVVERFAGYLGTALAQFACVVDPEVIVIGGGVSRAGQVLSDCVSKYYRKKAFPSCKDTPIVLAKLGNDAGIYGSARLVLD